MTSGDFGGAGAGCHTVFSLQTLQVGLNRDQGLKASVRVAKAPAHEVADVSKRIEIAKPHCIRGDGPPGVTDQIGVG
jgi:hypothetical protein